MKTSPSSRNPSSSILDRARTRNELHLEETKRGRPRVATRDSESYIVPMVARAIDISELLQEFNSGLHVKGIKELTGYADSTIYRILRTLAAFGYVARDSNGVYRLNTKTLRMRKTLPIQAKKINLRPDDLTPHPPVTN